MRSVRVLPAALVLGVVMIAACGGASTIVRDDAGATAVDACAVTDVDLVADASPGTCELSPADVACNASSDCKVLLRLGCECFVPAVGVNVSSTAGWARATWWGRGASITSAGRS